MTYDELKTQIADFLNRSDLTSKLDFFIDATEGELNRRLRTKDMVVRATATADGQYLSLPTDWLEAINIEITSGDFGELQVVPSNRSRARTALLLDPEYAKVSYLRDFETIDISTIGDAETKMIVVEFGLEVSNEAAHGAVYDLSTS